jgi:hypothetical protein
VKERLVHKFKLAYCTSRPALWVATFAVPPTINKLTGRPYESYMMVQDISARNCVVGHWYSLAYGKCQYGQGMKVIAEVTL